MGLQDARAAAVFFVTRRKGHKSDEFRREVQGVGKAAHRILASEDGDDFAADKELADVVGDGERRKAAHDAEAHEVLEVFGGGDGGRGVESSLVAGAVGLFAQDVAAGRLHPRQKPPRTVFDGERAASRPREGLAPFAELTPGLRRRFRVEAGLFDQILAVDDAVVCDARRRQGPDVAVELPDAVPERLRRGVRGNPFVEGVDEALADVVAEDVEPGLVYVGRGAAGEGEHEGGAASGAGQDEPAPFDRLQVWFSAGEFDYASRRRLFRSIRVVAEEEGDFGGGSGWRA